MTQTIPLITCVSALVGTLIFKNSNVANNSKYTPKGETDALTAVETDSESLSDGKIYDLTGRQISGDLSTLRPGVYIINHKKVLIR